MKFRPEDHLQEMMEAAVQYCNANHLDATKLPKSFCGISRGYAVIAQPNPNSQPELGIGDDANLPFPVLLVHFEQQDKNLHIWCEETEFTRKYLV